MMMRWGVMYLESLTALHLYALLIIVVMMEATTSTTTSSSSQAHTAQHFAFSLMFATADPGFAVTLLSRV